MKSRIAVKILRNCGYDLAGFKSPKYNKQQVREAVEVSLRDLDPQDRFNVRLDYLSGGNYDTYRWRGCEIEGWEKPWLDFYTANRIGQYLV